MSDALEATSPEPAFDAGGDEFAAETEFVDQRALRAAASAGRAATTRQAIDAARAAMTAPAAEAPARSGFGLKRGGKSKLQERLDKQASKDGSTVRKALGASAIAVALTGGVYAYAQVTGRTLPFPDFGETEAQPIAALATTPTATLAEVQALYDKAVTEIEADDAKGAETMKQAATAGSTPAQLYLLGLFESGQSDLKPEEARVFARKAAEAQDPKGMHAYAMYLFDGIGGDRNRGEAMDWLLKAAERGLIDSQYNVAKLYESGDVGIPVNLADAYKWYLIASRSGDPDAQEAVQRLAPQVPAAARTAARNAAAAFTADPLG